MTPMSSAQARKLSLKFLKSHSREMILSLVLLILAGLGLTLFCLQKIPLTAELALRETQVSSGLAKAKIIELRDRFGERLDLNFETRWNLHDRRRLDELPRTLREALILAEDRNFFAHSGVDWSARLASLWGWVRTGRLYRGASTVSEQVVRILHPRPRNLWSRWLETLEAYDLDATWDKLSILEFYLNQVPYGGEQRGVVQAANYYFGRDVETLNEAECLALAVLVRAPSALSPHKNRMGLQKRMALLAKEFGREVATDLELAPAIPVRVAAPSFVRQVRFRLQSQMAALNSELTSLTTTLHGGLQARAHRLLSLRIHEAKAEKVEAGAILIADGWTGDILTYVTAGETQYDMVQKPRQPGSTMKPFLYALALEKGWTAAQVLVDEPFATKVGRGVHAVRNYSRVHYGPVPLRMALGNSLNVPAVKTIGFVKPAEFLQRLHKLGINSLSHRSQHYGEGLALGAGEVSLFELVQAYTIFVNEGQLRPLRYLLAEPPGPLYIQTEKRVFEPEVVSLIGHILSDPKARNLEFGRGSILNFQSPLAVKTGTSTDYRDAWALAFNDRYIVGIWTGRADAGATLGNSGAKLPALVLRSIIGEMAQVGLEAGPPKLHKNLVPREICFHREDRVVHLADEDCAHYTEYFLPGTESVSESLIARSAFEETDSSPTPFQITFPPSGLEVAIDPRIPRTRQQLKFHVTTPVVKKKSNPLPQHFEWYVNDQLQAVTQSTEWFWPIEPGPQNLRVRAIDAQGATLAVDSTYFFVK